MLFSRVSQIDGKKQYLEAHLKNVAKHCGEKLEPVGLKNLGILMGLCHDFGKISPQWQKYLLSGEGNVTHASGGVHFLRNLSTTMKETPYHETLYHKFLIEMLELVIQGHHGGLRDALSPIGIENQVEENFYSDVEWNDKKKWFFREISSEENTMDLLAKAQIELKNMVESMKNRVATLEKPSFSGAQNQCLQLQISLLVQLIHSVLIDADRFDAAAFEDEIEVTATKPWGNLAKKVDQMTFEAEGINIYRKLIAEEAKDFSCSKSGIYQFSAPTGAGKTLSSLRFALETAETHEKERIFFIAPFLTILEQNADSVRKALDLEKDNPILLEHHSNFVEGVEKKEKLTRRDLSTERWDAQIIFTSLTQFLNTGFRGDSRRRLQGLMNSVIIIDEIQSIPTRCLYFFHSFLHFLRDTCHCVILTTTATPPTLPEHFFQLDYEEPKEIVTITKEMKVAFQRTFFQVLEGEWEDEQISELISEKQQEYQSVLCICNTKSTAFSLYSMVKERTSIPVIYLSTELCPSHRSEKIKGMKQLLSEKKPVICISTQLIEAGVDVSFPCVIRTMAGLSSIIQAAGRCNRHGEGGNAPVYAIHSTSEQLDMLPDILEGRRITNELHKALPELPLESNEALEYYFKNFYSDKEPLLKNGLFELFATNPKGKMAYEEENGSRYPKNLAQAFQTVGRKFTVIADNTIGVIVPYGKAFSLVSELKEASSTKEKRNLYRQLQRFAVNVYENKLRTLSEDGAIYYDKDLELWCMNEAFYDDTTGIRKTKNIDHFIL